MTIHIRDATHSDAPALAHVLVEATETTFRGRVPDQCLVWTEKQSAASWRRALRSGFSDDTFLVGAEDQAGQVVGYAMGGAQSDEPGYDGELKQISILSTHQRQSVGRQLVVYVAARLALMGLHS